MADTDNASSSRPRRKRVQNGSGHRTSTLSSMSSNGSFAATDVGRSGDESSAAENGSYDKIRGRYRHRSGRGRGGAWKEKVKSRRRRRGALPLLLAGSCLCCIWMIFKAGPLAMKSQQAPGNSESESAEERLKRMLAEMPPDSPLTEEQEQRLVSAARSELDEFPISIGADDGTNPGWETIRHPGIEALQHFEGADYKSPLRKKRKSAEEVAAALAGKKLRGGNGDNGAPEGEAKADGDGREGLMRVPKLWDPTPYRIVADEREKRSGISGRGNGSGTRRYLGNYGSRLMTPAESESIGSRVRDERTGEVLETIFVAVASYRDFQCASTVESAFLRAERPERIRVAVVDQIREGEDRSCSVPPRGSCEENPDQMACRHASQIDYLTLDAELSVGPVFARHLGHRLYRGEYFAVQSDAHVSFVRGWDTEIVEQWRQAENEMAILSTYLSGTNDHIDLETGERTSKSRPVMCMSDFEGEGGFKHLRHGQQPEGVPYLREPVLDPFWAAGFSFGRGHFVVNVPYDQHLPWIFQGEEISIGLRGFTYGYDFYSPEKSVCYHFYGRKDVPMFWENTSIYRGSGMYGMNRLNAIIKMTSPSINGETKEWIRTDEVKYGLGRVRDIQKFFDTFGIHVKEQRVEPHLCKFVGRPMQKEFMSALRANGMGLDYSKIHFQWKDK
ncbi:hypothetical protein ACHAWF_003827 [Thalassiosira exigua]